MLEEYPLDFVIIGESSFNERIAKLRHKITQLDDVVPPDSPNVTIYFCDVLFISYPVFIKHIPDTIARIRKRYNMQIILLADTPVNVPDEDLLPLIDDCWNGPLDNAAFTLRVRTLERLIYYSKHITTQAGILRSETVSPLASIQGYAEILQLDLYGSLNNEQVRLVQTIYKNARFVKDMVEQVSMWSALYGLRTYIAYNETMVVEVINACIDQYKRKKIPPPKEVYVQVADAVSNIQIEQRITSHVLLVLLDNATRYSIRDMPISITVDPITAVNQYFIRIAVQNHGEISESRREYIFRAFLLDSALYPDNTRRIGLNLYLSKLWIEKLGGQMWFESADSMTTFYFTLPVAQS